MIVTIKKRFRLYFLITQKLNFMKNFLIAFFTLLLNTIPFGVIYPQAAQKNNNVTATITKNTSDKQLQDLKKYFEENAINVDIKNTKRNNQNEITSITIEIKKESQQSNYNLNSNTPINNLELGYKNGDVFIKNTTKAFTQEINNSLQDLLSDFNKINNQSIDSILSENQFSFSFGTEDIQKLLDNSSINFDELQQQFFNHFFKPNSDETTSNLGTPSQNKKRIPKYSFFNLKQDKLIIIDGKESNYDTLSDLANKDLLEEVDNLKPTTAISIYGNKAKNGAIIAISKK